MRTEALKAAIDLIRQRPADQPLMRLIELVMQHAQCPMGLIGIHDGQSQTVLVSKGLPLVEFEADPFTRTAATDRSVYAAPFLVEDASLDPALAICPYVAGNAGWRFIASVPVPLVLSSWTVYVQVADHRTDVPRPDNVLLKLSDCAAIIADELRLIGDIAIQTQQVAAMRSDMALREAFLRSSSLPMAMVDAEGTIALANEPFRMLKKVAGIEASANRLSDIFADDDITLTHRVASVITEQRIETAVRAQIAGTDHNYIIDFAATQSPHNTRPLALCTVTDRTRTTALTEWVERGDEGEPPEVVADFLFDTLIWQQRIQSRNKVSYHTLARWRRPIRDAQIAALRALKRAGGTHFLNRLAERMASSAQAIYGEGAIKAVAAVPCGNTGPGCPSGRLGRRVADRLKLPYLDQFAPLPAQGGSHPRQNLKRPTMRLRAPVPDIPILLIDDVATTGTHIEEATLLLRSTAPVVMPLVWISP